MKKTKKLHNGKLDPSEQEILNSIIEYLALIKIPYIHVRNSGSIVHGKNGSTFFAKPKYFQRGVADIIANVKGRAVAIEVKTRKGKLSEFQEDWLEKWEEANGFTLVARSVNDVVGAVSLLGDTE